MLFVNYSIDAPGDQVVGNLVDSSKIEAAEKYDTKNGKPHFHVKTKDDTLKIKCEMLGRGTKDNAFLEGTYFLGKVSEKNNRTSVRGIILTAPIYHLCFAALFVFFIIKCFSVGGFAPTPILLLGFDFIMFKDEFKKQSLIKRYILRAFKVTYQENNGDKK